jgi:micrococcal nuclease
VIVLALVLSRCGEDDGRDADSPAESASSLRVRVVEVFDGDTIEVELQDGSREHVRYIGIDTPETPKPDAPGECGAERARAVNERLVGGRELLLRFDAERRDDYERLLAYVFVPTSAPGLPPLLVNAELMRRGLARPLTIEPNDSRAALFERLAARAGSAGLGIWGACPV